MFFFYEFQRERFFRLLVFLFNFLKYYKRHKTNMVFFRKWQFIRKDKILKYFWQIHRQTTTTMRMMMIAHFTFLQQQRNTKENNESYRLFISVLPNNAFWKLITGDLFLIQLRALQNCWEAFYPVVLNRGVATPWGVLISSWGALYLTSIY